MKHPFILLLILILAADICTAQQIDPALRDSLHIKKTFPKYQILIPATMITYGIVSIQNEKLKSVNANMKEEIWIERSHKQLSIDNYLQWAPAVAVYGLNAAGIKGAHNFRDRTIIYGLSTAIMSSIVFTGKSISKEWRPDGSNNYSFPSGHTANAFAAAEFLRREYKDVSIWYGVAGYAVAATTGYLRMYNNKHWLSDVVAGAGVGILSTNLAYYLYPSVKKIFEKDHQKPVVAVPLYSGGAVGLSLVYQF